MMDDTTTPRRKAPVEPESPHTPTLGARKSQLSSFAACSPGVHDPLLLSDPSPHSEVPQLTSPLVLADPTQVRRSGGTAPRAGKLILDRVYEHVFMPNVAVAVIDTPEFQRLRTLKQLGSVSYLYPGAMHTRFEHSIGVAHLASVMIKKIARRQPSLGVTEADVLCVTLAGLCHDLGHGPFSHLFEVIVNRQRSERNLPHWHHEDMSCTMLRRIMSKLELKTFGLDERDVNLIELCIQGLAPGAPWDAELVGRSEKKRFLLDIVSNKRNGVDVDKLDYFMRDSLGCYGRVAVDCHIPRLLSSCRVINMDGEYQVCFEEKMAQPLGDIFTLRAKLHKYAYQHRISKVVDHMVSDTLSLADPYFLVRGRNGEAKRISDCVDDVDGFVRLGDWVLAAIEASTDPKMADAQRIISDLNQRRLYSIAGMAMFASYLSPAQKSTIKKEIMTIIEEQKDRRSERNKLVEITDETFIVDLIRIHYGSSDSEGNPDDPINKVAFYNPKVSTKAFHLPRDRVSPLFSPSQFGEKSLVVLSRVNSKQGPHRDIISAAFEEWRTRNASLFSTGVPVYNNVPSTPSMSRGAKRPR